MEFLGDDGGGGFRIQKAVADDLADQFVGAAVIGFGTAGRSWSPRAPAAGSAL